MSDRRFRDVALLAGLSDERLDWLADRAEEITLAPGAFLFHEGTPATHFYVVTSGHLEGMRRVAGGDVVTDHHGPLGFIGAVPLLTGDANLASVYAPDGAVAWRWDAACFDSFLAAEPDIRRRLGGVASDSFRNWESAVSQREKLAALGTMAAGLAHELNNPAAAARQSAEQLAEAVGVLLGTIGRFAACAVERADTEVLAALQLEALAQAVRPSSDGGLHGLDGEDRIIGWLDDHDVPESWRLAPVFAGAGLDEDWLDRVASAAHHALPAAVEWIAAGLLATDLVAELRESTSRISGLVGAVKEYTYMDRAAEQDVDVNAGLDSTLKILGHRLKDGSIHVERRYADDLPPIVAFGSELNQVWTNLIANAIDALAGRGTLRLETRRDGESVRVDITDDGPGVPAAIQGRIFEPFYTTKPVGAGTGLGLDLAYRIVVTQHRGELTLDSVPGRTQFTVRLPIEPTDPALEGSLVTKPPNR